MKLATMSVAAILMLGSAVPAQAAKDKPVDMKPVHGNGYVIVNPASSATATLPDGRTFMPTGDISPETLVVVSDPDGSLPGAMTQTDLTTMVAEQQAKRASGEASLEKDLVLNAQPAKSGKKGDTGYTTMGQRQYGVTNSWRQFTGSSQIGTTDTTRLNYWFNVTNGTAQWAEGQGLGYYRGYNGGTFGTWSAFYAMGTAKSGVGGGASVPWGNTAAMTQFRARALNGVWANGFWGP